MRADLLLVGFGNVGRRFARLLDEQRERLARDHDLQYRIAGIVTRRHGSVFDSGGIDALDAVERVEQGQMLSTTGLASTSAADIIAAFGRSSRTGLPVVVETTTLDIHAGEPAISHVRSALAAGCHVVTANKGPAAFAYASLRDDASRRDLSFLFEGAVMDGVPVFNLVRETLPAVDVRGFRGVVNSTTNHILTALEDGDAFAPALARMQAEGIAEADPRLDIDGWDAAAKAAALANVLLDGAVTPHDVRREGIDERAAARAVAAKERGKRLRLVVSGARGERPRVELLELPADDMLAGLRGTANALILETDLLGRIAVYQLGGDLTQTAYALLTDLVTIRRRASAGREAQSHRIP